MKLSLLKLLSLAALVCLIGCGGGDDNPADNKDNNSANNGGNNNNNNNNNGGGTVIDTSFVELGGLKWMKKNLNIQTANSWCYDNKPTNCTTYGRLYAWESAKTACPSGWRLPTRDEWTALVTAAGDSSTAGKKLKSTSGWNDGYGLSGNGTDDFGFSALPGGSRDSDGDFNNAGDGGNWWTATENDADYAYYRYMYYRFDGAYKDASSKSKGFSVRCVKQ